MYGCVCVCVCMYVCVCVCVCVRVCTVQGGVKAGHNAQGGREKLSKQRLYVRNFLPAAVTEWQITAMEPTLAANSQATTQTSRTARN